MNIAAYRNQYVNDSIATASPARLLCMLYDRLVLDLMLAEKAQRERDWTGAHEQLTHAQDILIELRTSLDVDAWSGAPRLASIYAWSLSELIGANVHRDADRTADVLRVIEPLREAWAEAAATVAAEATG